MRFFQSKIMGLFWVGKIKIEYSYQIKVSLLGQLLVLKTSSRLVWLERHLKRFLTFESGLHFYFATVRYSLMWVAVSWTQSFDVHGHSLRFQMFQNNFFFLYFSGGEDSRPGRFFWHQYGSNWTLHYTANKVHGGVLCHKISSFDTVAMQKRFWQEYTW